MGQPHDDPELSTEEERRETVIAGVCVEAADAERALFSLAQAQRTTRGRDPLAGFAALVIQEAERSTAQLFQDVFVLYVLKMKRDGFFVEVGTGDGRLISNTYLLEKEFGWGGIVVEPNPIFETALIANRDCIISSDCIHERTGETVRFRCTADPEFSAISTYLDAGLHVQRQNVEFQEIELETLSLNDLLEAAGAPDRINYISLDIEGAELAVLRGFDFDRWTVDCMTVEHNWGENRDAIHALLTERGYRRMFEAFAQWDDWYVRQDLALLEEHVA